MAQSELQSIVNDPTQAIAIGLGPAFPELVPQQPGSGLQICRRCEPQIRRFVFKKAHMSREDYRIFNSSGHVVAALWHHGKNPYEKFDPVGTSNFAQAHESRYGEWESAANVAGYNGMAGLKIRPKAVSRHGRQWVYQWGSKEPLFNIGKESKLKSMSLRSNIAVRAGDGKDVIYRILPDLVGRTFQVVNTNNELVCFAQKSAKALIMEATLGAGSEMVIDVAAGADWTAMVAIVMALRQVGAHFVKDALKNYVFEPLKESAVDSTLSATGLTGAASAVGGAQDAALKYTRMAQQIHHMFFT
ncbi:MAG: hypothetical protein J3K34DRAFT_423322 [Monoraphidium minutum]|nr:MAG: hypothetical protein J3K34DRAFT_423322 [Monoraphidium minutum]